VAGLCFAKDPKMVAASHNAKVFFDVKQLGVETLACFKSVA
jgi:hypothetical protein